nr:MAG TPA: hypothetical protein [Caudoviricetes sp.]
MSGMCAHCNMIVIDHFCVTFTPDNIPRLPRDGLGVILRKSSIYQDSAHIGRNKWTIANPDKTACSKGIPNKATTIIICDAVNGLLVTVRLTITNIRAVTSVNRPIITCVNIAQRLHLLTPKRYH